METIIIMLIILKQIDVLKISKQDDDSEGLTLFKCAMFAADIATSRRDDRDQDGFKKRHCFFLMLIGRLKLAVLIVSFNSAYYNSHINFPFPTFSVIV